MKSAPWLFLPYVVQFPMVELLIATICMTLLFGLVLFFLLQSVFGVPYVPSMGKHIREVFSQLNLQDKKFVDLGSGDGKIVILAARQGAQAYGVEINPALVAFSWIRALMFNVHVHFRHASYYDYALHDVDVVYIYLLPAAMEKLLPKFQRQLRPGSIVISNTFQFKEMQPDQVLNSQFYIYKFWASSQ